jgi:drug/metabolite transporter (DMT)-like permease
MGAGLGPDLIKGFLVLQVGSFLWCLGSVLQKKQQTTAHPVVSGAIQQLATGLVVLPVASFIPEHPVNWHSRGIWAIVYLVIFGSIVGYSAYIYALEHLPVSVVSTYAYANPIVAVFLGWLFYREPFGWREAAAMALVITGVVVVKYFGHPAPKAQEAAAKFMYLTDVGGLWPQAIVSVIPLAMVAHALSVAVRRALSRLGPDAVRQFVRP